MSKKNLQQRLEELESMPKEVAQARGRYFEELVQDLFEKEGLLHKRGYHTSDDKSEQIDGAIIIDGVRALLEAKWVESNLAASELYAFSGKVEGKFIGTIGVFISRRELSNNFLRSLRQGRRQSIVVIHGKDVEYIFQKGFPLKDYLNALLNSLSFDNLPHLSAERFIEKYESQKEPKTSNGEQEEYLKAIEEAMGDRDISNIAEELVDDTPEDQRSDFLKSCLHAYAFKKGGKGFKGCQEQNISSLICAIIERLPESYLESDWYFFDDLSRSFVDSMFTNFLYDFTGRFEYLTKEQKQKVNDRLIRKWEKSLGDYYLENELALVTRPMWELLDKKVQKKLLSIFLNFLVSDRRPTYPQMKVATEIVNEAHNKDAALVSKLIRKLLVKKVKVVLDGDLDESEMEEWLKRNSKWYSRQFSAWDKYVEGGIDENVAKVVNNYAN